VMVYSAGGVGMGEDYRFYTDAGQDNIDDPAALPESLKQLSEVNKIEKPSNHVAAWQCRDAFGSAVSYSATTEGINFCFLKNLVDWLEGGHNGDRGRFKRAQNMLLKRGREDAYMSKVKMYHLLLSKEVLDTWQRSGDWTKHHQEIDLPAGLRGAIGSDFVGMVDNVAILRGSRIPRFKRAGKTFAAGLLFGKMALVAGHRMRQTKLRYRPKNGSGDWVEATLRTPYKCRIIPMNSGIDSAILCQAEYGIRQVRYPAQRDTNPEESSTLERHTRTVSPGLCRIDIQE